MGLRIEDATGSGFGLKVDGKNRAHARAVSEAKDFDINLSNGKAWSLPFGPQDPTGANDFIFYLKNTGEKDISITDFRLSATGAGSRIQINHVIGTAVGGATITEVAKNLGSTELLSATAEEGTDITGLTSQGTIFFMELTVVDTLYQLKTTSNIVIPRGTAIAILVETATSVVTGVVSVVEQE